LNLPGYNKKTRKSKHEVLYSFGFGSCISLWQPFEFPRSQAQ